MRRLGFLLAGALLIVGCTSTSEPASKLTAYTEAFGYAKALEVAKKENKRLFIDFSATWCGPCQQLKKTLTDPRVARALQDYVILLIDVDKDPKLTAQFNVGPIPAYFVVDGDGQWQNLGTGYKDVAQFLAWLKQGGSGG
ncbi:MAG TPA: thioredoxin family protein [Gemmataceae bacterium]|nr:thioredoxin family protein [Gemmataceae bacterium]